MKTIYLVSCVSEKRNTPMPAEELYDSDLFRKASSFIKKKGASWLILSAKYGVVNPATIIEPYNETLNKMGVGQRRVWASRVSEELKKYIHPGDTVVFFAGARYREFLIEPILKIGCHIEIPMDGLRIGKQLKWLKEHL